MAGTGIVILGTLAGAAAVGGALVAIDPLGARKSDAGGNGNGAAGTQMSGGASTSQVSPEEWGHTGVEKPGEALHVLGYAPSGQVTGTDVKNFQSDVNEVLAWVRATKAGHVVVPPAGAGFTQIPVVLRGMPAAPPLGLTGNMDAETLMALGKVLQVVTLASGTPCLTPQGQAVDASISACQGEWQEAFRYAYEGNLATPGTAT